MKILPGFWFQSRRYISVVDKGSAKVALPFANYIVCTLAPPISTAVPVFPLFTLDIQRGPNNESMCMFNEILIARYLLN